MSVRSAFTGMIDKQKSPWSKPWDFLRQYLRSEDKVAMVTRPVSQVMDGLQALLRPFLKEHGFRGRGRHFNSRTHDGLTHVITFQMGRYDPPGTVHYPPFTENLYGKFTLNLGVFVPEAHALFLGKEPGLIIAESDCALRARLGELGPEQDDLWWPVQDDEVVVKDITTRLVHDGFPFFAQFESRDLILNNSDFAQKERFALNGRLTRAAILHGRGDFAGARDLMVQQVSEAERTGSPQHASHVRKLATKLGLAPI